MIPESRRFPSYTSIVDLQHESVKIVVQSFSCQKMNVEVVVGKGTQMRHRGAVGGRDFSLWIFASPYDIDS